MYSLRSIPPHVAGKRATLQKQLRVVEQTIKDDPPVGAIEAGSIPWLLAHERHLLNVALRYDERAQAEWEAAQDWNLSAHEGPVSKIFVTQPSRFGLTPEQHQYRVGQARTLGSNAMDLWRFSDLNYQDAYKIRGSREKLQAEATKRDGQPVDQETKGRDRGSRKDFQTWLKEVSKGDDESARLVTVKNDGSLNRLSKLSVEDPQ